MEPFKFLVLTGWHEHIAIAICVLAIFIIPMCIMAISDAMAESRAEKERQEHYHRFYYVDARVTYELCKDYWMHIFVDKETRVQYLGQFMTPWIDENGKPILYTGDFDEPNQEQLQTISSSQQKHRFYYVDCRITYELYGFDWMNMLVDKETRVQYIMNLDGKTAPWIDENGKPILYTGDFDEPNQDQPQTTSSLSE